VSDQPKQDNTLRRLERDAREAETRMRDHPELDGEGIQLALEHEWALIDLARATENPEGPRHGDAYVRPREIAAG